MSDEAKNKKATLTDAQITTSNGFGRRAFLLGTFGSTAALAGCVQTGITDADTGAYADPAGAGRGGTRIVTYRSGIPDADTGAYADPAGNGRGRRSCTDADTGYYSDPVGGGRRC